MRASPFFQVDRLSKPMLIARGDRDDALPPGDLDQFVAEAGKRGQQAVSVVYEGDGHFFRRENQLDFFARAEALLALECVTRVVVYDEPTPATVILTLVPDVLVKGADWPLHEIVGRETVLAHGGRVVRVPLVDGQSTTAVVDRIRRT